jgi:protein-L-isoaspartate O-methyltransferase
VNHDTETELALAARMRVRAVDATSQLPRVQFLPRTFFAPGGPDHFCRYHDDGRGTRGRNLYVRTAGTSRPLVTEFDQQVRSDRIAPGVTATVCVPPASVVRRILTELGPHGCARTRRVLQVHPGVGYLPALMQRYLGSQATVTSTESRADLAQAAASLLRRVDGRVRVEHRDVLGGQVRAGEGWDAIVVGTVLTGHFPPALIRCARPGAVVIAPFATSYAPGLQVLAHFVVGPDGDRAEGRIVESVPPYSFPQEPLTPADGLEREPDRVRRVGPLTSGFLPSPRWFSPAQFIIGMRVPHCRMTMTHHGNQRTIRWTDTHPAGAGSVAVLTIADKARYRELREFGPPLWERITGSRDWWHSHQRPAPHRFGITALATGDIRYWVDTPSQVVTLPSLP